MKKRTLSHSSHSLVDAAQLLPHVPHEQHEPHVQRGDDAYTCFSLIQKSLQTTTRQEQVAGSTLTLTLPLVRQRSTKRKRIQARPSIIPHWDLDNEALEKAHNHIIRSMRQFALVNDWYPLSTLPAHTEVPFASCPLLEPDAFRSRLQSLIVTAFRLHAPARTLGPPLPVDNACEILWDKTLWRDLPRILDAVVEASECRSPIKFFLYPVIQSALFIKSMCRSGHSTETSMGCITVLVDLPTEGAEAAAWQKWRLCVQGCRVGVMADDNGDGIGSSKQAGKGKREKETTSVPAEVWGMITCGDFGECQSSALVLVHYASSAVVAFLSEDDEDLREAFIPSLKVSERVLQTSTVSAELSSIQMLAVFARQKTGRDFSIQTSLIVSSVVLEQSIVSIRSVSPERRA